MDGFLKDRKHSARLFLQAPGFTIVAIAALALGMGTNTAIFSVVNTVLLKPLAFPDPEKIVLFQNLFKQGGRSGVASPNEYNFWRQQTQTFQDVSAYAFNVANLTGEAAPEQIQITRASANFLRLCAIGIYGLMAYSVAQRTQEIGLRLAMGAGSSKVRNMVVFQGLRLALAGVVVGIAAAVGLTRLIASLLFGVKALDLTVFSAVAAGLIGVALVAVWLPALRASRVDPIHALRYE
jgi:FtsX-like permease family